ncbi:hypothetical protein ACKKBF_B08885 [Auxenochlorella protothecoides x Auxenochlorella symbiontica]
MSEAAGEAGRGEAVVESLSPPPLPPQLLSVAPMMDWTDLHYRQLARMISRHTWLYTEMVVDKTLIHNPDHDRFLWFPPEQHPIVCQLGGSDPDELAAAARIVAGYGYDEINLNVGCPSDRVAGAGCFGAALMLRPELVARCCAAIAAAVDIPVTVKCRLGVDNNDSYEELVRFVHTVSTGSPVTHFIVHARKAHLKGLNPHQNRTVPPLRYQWVWALARDFPHLSFSLNGGVAGLDGVVTALRADPGPLAGVMVGRGAYHAPWDVLADADRRVFGGSNAALSRRVVLDTYAAYADAMVGRWGSKPDGWRAPSLRTLFKPVLGMFAGEPRARQWRAAVDAAFKQGAGSVRGVLDATLHVLLPESLDAAPREEGDGGAAGPAHEALRTLQHWEPELPPTPEWLAVERELGRGAAEREGGKPAAEEGEAGSASQDSALTAADKGEAANLRSGAQPGGTGSETSTSGNLAQGPAPAGGAATPGDQQQQQEESGAACKDDGASHDESWVLVEKQTSVPLQGAAS